MPNTPTILVQEDTAQRQRWRNYMVIDDNRCVIIEMIPAVLSGWNVRSVTVQGDESWCGMSQDQIVAFKMNSNHPPAVAELTPAGRESLLKLAREGNAP